MSIRKVPVFATIVVIAAVATMIGLGFWQLGRMDEKEAQIARFEASAGNQQVLYALPDDPLDHLYRKVRFTCSDARSWNAIAGRSANDRSGYAQIVQCPEADVVLGWAPGPQAVSWDGGEVSGMIAPGGEQGWRIVADPPLAGLAANASPDPGNTPNNHLAYAGQWFFFALTALIIYILALRRRWR